MGMGEGGAVVWPDPQIVAAVVGAVLGGLLAAAAGYFLDWLRQRDARRNVSVALRAEISIMVGALDTATSTEADLRSEAVAAYIALRTFETPAFSALAGQIGLLNTDITESVIRFYLDFKEVAPEAAVAADGSRAAGKLSKRLEQLKGLQRRGEELIAALGRAVG